MTLVLLFVSVMSACTLMESGASFFPSQEKTDAALPADGSEEAPPPPPGPGIPLCTPASCDDGLLCTRDVCEAGHCRHVLLADRCLIAGRCLREGERLTGSCEVCASRLSTTSATFAGGLSCDDGDAATVADTCLAGRCQGFSARTWAPGDGGREAVFYGVARVPRSMHVWAVGRYQSPGSSHPRGMIVRLEGAAAPTHEALVTWPLTAIHGDLAAGEGGQAFLYSATTERPWRPVVSLSPHLGDLPVNSVWMARGGSNATYYLAVGRGDRLLRCEGDASGVAFGCERQVGLEGKIIRVGAARSAPSPLLWALRGDGRQDIFTAVDSSSASGASPRWSTSGTRGCTDDPTLSGACVDTLGPFTDLWVGSTTSAWAVGHHGLVLRYDGVRWRRVVFPALTDPPISDYAFRGVWGSGPVIVLVGERPTAERWELVAMMYNTRLDRWYAPKRLLSLSDSPSARAATHLFDVAGRGPGEIYFVGSRLDGAQEIQRGVIFSRGAPSP